MSLKKASRIWNYFKKGRGEIGLILALYNMILTYSIKFNIDFTTSQYIIISVVFGVTCVFLGIFLAEKVEPQNNVISPYAQDNLMSAIYLQQSLIAHYEGREGEAIELMSKAVQLRNKWLK